MQPEQDKTLSIERRTKLRGYQPRFGACLWCGSPLTQENKDYHSYCLDIKARVKNDTDSRQPVN